MRIEEEDVIMHRVLRTYTQFSSWYVHTYSYVSVYGADKVQSIPIWYSMTAVPQPGVII